MARLQLFEWEDQPWLPSALRDFVTDHLRFAFNNPRAAGMRRTIAEILIPPSSDRMRRPSSTCARAAVGRFLPCFHFSKQGWDDRFARR